MKGEKLVSCSHWGLFPVPSNVLPFRRVVSGEYSEPMTIKIIENRDARTP